MKTTAAPPAPNSTTAIWSRAIKPTRRGLDAAAARALLKLRLSRRDLERADALARAAGQRALTEAEAHELENFRTVGTALEFLKSKARLCLHEAN